MLSNNKFLREKWMAEHEEYLIVANSSWYNESHFDLAVCTAA